MLVSKVQCLRAMAQTDLALRRLAELHLRDLLTELFTRLTPGAGPDGRGSTHLVPTELEVLGIERTELKIIERTADEVARVRLDGVETILHVEFQTSHTADLPARMLAYHGLLRQRHHPLPVRSLLVYLMSEAPPAPLPRGLPRGGPADQLDFWYDVFCVWEHPIGLSELVRNPALAPIATLTPGIEEADLPAVRRLIAAAPLGRQGQDELLLLTGLVAGRRFSSALLRSFWWRENMHESPIYRMIAEESEARGRAEGKAEGRAETLKHAIRVLVQTKLGQVPEGLDERLAGLDAEALDTLFQRLMKARKREVLACLAH